MWKLNDVLYKLKLNVKELKTSLNLWIIRNIQIWLKARNIFWRIKHKNIHLLLISVKRDIHFSQKSKLTNASFKQCYMHVCGVVMNQILAGNLHFEHLHLNTFENKFSLQKCEGHFYKHWNKTLLYHKIFPRGHLTRFILNYLD